MKNGDRSKKLEKIINKKREIKVRDKIRLGSTAPSYNENQENHPKVVKKTTLVYPVSV